MGSAAKAFGDYAPDASNWITLASGEYYPDILPHACELYKPVLVLFGQLLKGSESSTALFMSISDVREGWMRVQLARVFRKYVCPSLSVEMLRRKRQATRICERFSGEFRKIAEVQRAFATRPVPDEAICALLWEYKDRGKKGYDTRLRRSSGVAPCESHLSQRWPWLAIGFDVARLRPIGRTWEGQDSRRHLEDGSRTSHPPMVGELTMATGIPSRQKRHQGAYQLAYTSKMSRAEVLAMKRDPGLPVGCGTAEDRLYLGDNLPILLHLVDDPTLRGCIRCVYIDPPYATASSFVDRDVNHAYDDTVEGAAYLEFLRRRLIVLRELIAVDGTIFVHLDQTMVFEVKLIMDEVFGRENFRNFITRKKCNTKNYTRRKFGNVSDHILFYSKADDFVWHRPHEAWREQRVQEEYPYVDATGRRYKRVPVHAPGTRNGATGTPWRGKLPPPGKHWQYPPEKLDELDHAGEIYWSPNGNPRRKVFYDRSRGIPVQDIWLDFKDAHNQNIEITGYPTEKNCNLLERIVRATTNPGDWVLDCFCGSGTALEAARSLGRHFVGIDSSQAAIDATLKRLTTGRQPMGDFVGIRGNGKKIANAAPSLFD